MIHFLSVIVLEPCGGLSILLWLNNFTLAGFWKPRFMIALSQKSPLVGLPLVRFSSESPCKKSWCSFIDHWYSNDKKNWAESTVRWWSMWGLKGSHTTHTHTHTQKHTSQKHESLLFGGHMFTTQNYWGTEVTALATWALKAQASWMWLPTPAWPWAKSHNATHLHSLPH